MIEAASEQPARRSGISTVFAGIEQLGGLGHEMHAGQHDHVGIGRRRLAGQRQAVADDVGDAVEDVRRLVVVRQDDGVALALQLQDRVDVGREGRPFDRRIPTSPVGRAGLMCGEMDMGHLSLYSY